MFFFEKKNQKTFVYQGQHPIGPFERPAGRHALLLFFKKEVLPSLLYTTGY
jgi:hypothetical protein